MASSKYVVIYPPTQDNKVTGRHADVIQAGYIASEIAHRMVVPGGEVRGKGGKGGRGRRKGRVSEEGESGEGRIKGGGRVRE